MYGAMDGAMKFVKGDSIAGMIIAVVNIVGGTIIGITQNGMTAGDALHTYGILTIGDGLVSQIPSLLISISAGILITRTGDSDDNVGSQIGLQIFAQPKALLMAGGLVFLFALIPGFPKPQLFTLAALLGGLGYVLKRVNETPQARTPKRNSPSRSRPRPAPSPAPARRGTSSRPPCPSSSISRRTWAHPSITLRSMRSWRTCAARSISISACPSPASTSGPTPACRNFPTS